MILQGGGRALPFAALLVMSVGATAVAQSPVASPAASPSVSPSIGPVVMVVAQEYRFGGLPTSLPAGTRLELMNDGAEVHQIVVARRVDGVTQSWDELLADPDAVGAGLITVEGQLFASPGQVGNGEITLTSPGDYFAVCFVPQGVTEIPDPDATREPGMTPSASAAHAGPAHYLLGMRQEFTVTGPGSTPGPVPTMKPMPSAGQSASAGPSATPASMAPPASAVPAIVASLEPSTAP